MCIYIYRHYLTSMFMFPDKKSHEFRHVDAKEAVLVPESKSNGGAWRETHHSRSGFSNLAGEHLENHLYPAW